MLKRVSVFCGSSSGISPEYEAQASSLGRILAARKIGLIYGGTNVGLMGVIADAALKAGGEVTGVLPEFINKKGISHRALTRLILVKTMHERKMVMHEMCDGIIAMPGGFGTLEEFFEALTWGQLGLHKKPAAILNIAGFYDHLNALIDKMVVEGFLKEANRKMLIISNDIDDLIDRMENYKAPEIDKWIIRDPVA